MSVLIQRRGTGDVVLDADVNLTLEPPVGVALKPSGPLCGLPSAATAVHLPVGMKTPMTVRATREQASNKLLYAVPVEVNAAGDWRLHVFVSRGADTASCDCLLPVSLASRQVNGTMGVSRVAADRYRGVRHEPVAAKAFVGGTTMKPTINHFHHLTRNPQVLFRRQVLFN